MAEQPDKVVLTSNHHAVIKGGGRNKLTPGYRKHQIVGGSIGVSEKNKCRYRGRGELSRQIKGPFRYTREILQYKFIHEVLAPAQKRAICDPEKGNRAIVAPSQQCAGKGSPLRSSPPFKMDLREDYIVES